MWQSKHGFIVTGKIDRKVGGNPASPRQINVLSVGVAE